MKKKVKGERVKHVLEKWRIEQGSKEYFIFSYSVYLNNNVVLQLCRIYHYKGVDVHSAVEIELIINLWVIYLLIYLFTYLFIKRHKYKLK